MYNSLRFITVGHMKHLPYLPNKDSLVDLKHLVSQLMSTLYAVEALTLETPLHEFLLSCLMLKHMDTVVIGE
jgi:hypothetical protein